jgi:hypothetical protein
MVDITPVLAAIGAAGFIVGFAIQGTLSNFASGLMILAYRPFDTGDVVEAGGVTGKVESMNLVSTTIDSVAGRCRQRTSSRALPCSLFSDRHPFAVRSRFFQRTVPRVD